MSRRRRHDKRSSATISEKDVWQCCGKYYSRSIAVCKVCGRRVDNRANRRGHAKPEPGEQVALDKAVKAQKALRGAAGRRYVVTIERHGRRLDGDNFIGGAKQLRDVIAAGLGMQGDSEADGIIFSYEQVPSREKMTVIRIRAVQQINQKTGEGR